MSPHCGAGRRRTEAATFLHSPMDMSWDFVRRLQDLTDMPLVLKGIVTREDAALAVEQSVDGPIVSNHGGRGEESGRATIDSLPELVEGAAGKIPVLIDGGFRRGGDIFKALALGASAVCIGRPYLWGLGALSRFSLSCAGSSRRSCAGPAPSECGTSIAPICPTTAVADLDSARRRPP
jgi:hypothetical protein